MVVAAAAQPLVSCRGVSEAAIVSASASSVVVVVVTIVPASGGAAAGLTPNPAAVMATVFLKKRAVATPTSRVFLRQPHHRFHPGGPHDGGEAVDFNLELAHAFLGPDEGRPLFRHQLSGDPARVRLLLSRRSQVRNYLFLSVRPSDGRSVHRSVGSVRSAFRGRLYAYLDPAWLGFYTMVGINFL